MPLYCLCETRIGTRGGKKNRHTFTNTNTKRSTKHNDKNGVYIIFKWFDKLSKSIVDKFQFHY